MGQFAVSGEGKVGCCWSMISEFRLTLTRSFFIKSALISYITFCLHIHILPIDPYSVICVLSWGVRMPVEKMKLREARDAAKVRPCRICFVWIHKTQWRHALVTCATRGGAPRNSEIPTQWRWQLAKFDWSAHLQDFGLLQPHNWQ